MSKNTPLSEHSKEIENWKQTQLHYNDVSNQQDATTFSFY